MQSNSFLKIIKKYFFAGILTFLPIGITCFAIFFVTIKINTWITALIPDRYIQYTHTPLLGLFWKLCVILIVLSFFCLLGAIAHLYIGKKIVSISDYFMQKIPFFNKFYNLINKIIKMLFDKKSHFFKQVVRIEFPMKNHYSIAFLTNHANPKFIQSEEHYVHVFLPTSPNPTTGFFLMVPKSSIKELDLSLEDAMKLIISGGALFD